MIIDKTYFVGKIEVPNSQNVPLGDRNGNQIDLGRYIDVHEKEFLLAALGYAGYKSLMLSFTTTGTVKPDAEQRWKDLIEGKEYTNPEGFLVKWEGLRYVLGTQKYSLIADYVFSKFLPDYSRTFGSGGMQKEQSKTASTVSSIPRVAEAWNDFLKKYQGDCESYGEPRVVVGRYLSGVDFSNSGYSNTEVSMIKFMDDHSTVYPEVVAMLFDTSNSFGL